MLAGYFHGRGRSTGHSPSTMAFIVCSRGVTVSCFCFLVSYLADAGRQSSVGADRTVGKSSDADAELDNGCGRREGPWCCGRGLVVGPSTGSHSAEATHQRPTGGAGDPEADVCGAAFQSCLANHRGRSCSGVCGRCCHLSIARGVHPAVVWKGCRRVVGVDMGGRDCD